MISEELRYIQGSATTREAVALFEKTDQGEHKKICNIDVDLLTCGISTYAYGDGHSLKLSPELQLKMLEFVQNMRKAILSAYPVKTYKGWKESGFPTFQDYCVPGDTVDMEMVDYFVNSVPPVTLRSDCTQAGEAYDMQPDPETGHWMNTYITFSNVGGSLWRFKGYCFLGSTINRSTRKNRIVAQIEALRREISNVEKK